MHEHVPAHPGSAITTPDATDLRGSRDFATTTGPLGLSAGLAPIGGPVLLRKLQRRLQRKASGAGQPIEPTMRHKAERSLGVDLSDVQVHEGAEAAEASAAVGARAFAVGSDIVLGGSERNAQSEVMAHEIAHTVQQRGAAPEVARMALGMAGSVDVGAEVGGAGGAAERDADQAAGRILAGLPATVQQVGTAQVQRFEGGEHMELGDAGFGGRELTVGKVRAPAGLFTALQGDFYGSNWRDLEADCTERPDKVRGFLALLKREQRMRAEHEADPAHVAEPNMDGSIVAAESGSRAHYLKYAEGNVTHFSEKTGASQSSLRINAGHHPAYAPELKELQARTGANVAEYVRLHFEALSRACENARHGLSADVALAMDAGACHFLTDAFASGHARTPRQAMLDDYAAAFPRLGHRKVDEMVNGLPDTLNAAYVIGLPPLLSSSLKGPALSLRGVKRSMAQAMYGAVDPVMRALAGKVAGFAAKVLHDSDNRGGVSLHTLGDPSHPWLATGDHALSAQDENRRHAVAAVAASAEHTRRVYEAARAARDETGSEIPYISMRAIVQNIPVLDANDGPQTEWHWEAASPAFKDAVLDTALSSITGSVSGLPRDLELRACQGAEEAILQILEEHDLRGDKLNAAVKLCVRWLLQQVEPMIPTQDKILRFILVNA